MSDFWLSATIICLPIVFYGAKIVHAIIREKMDTRASLARLDALQKHAEERDQEFLAAFAAELRKGEIKKGIVSVHNR